MIAYDFALDVARNTKTDMEQLGKSTSKIATMLDKAKKTAEKLYENVQNMVVKRKLQNKQDKELIEKLKDQNKEHKKADEIVQKQLTSHDKLLVTLLKINVAAATLVQTYLAYKGVAMFIDYSDKLDEVLVRNMKTFGSYTKTIKAYSALQDRIAQGELFGKAEEYLQAAEIFAVQGVKFTKETQNMLNDLALFSGETVSDTAQVISQAISGGYTELARITGVTERMLATRFARYEGNTIMMRNAIMGFIKEQERLVGAAARAPKTFGDYFNQLSTFFKLNFFKQIFGDSTNPDSFVSLVKDTFAKVTDFIVKNGEIIRRVANGIGVVLRFAWEVVDELITSVVRHTQKGIDALQKFFVKYQERIAGMILYFALIKDDVVSAIKFVLKAWLVFESYIIGSTVFKIVGKGMEWLGLSMFNFRTNLVKTGRAIMTSLIPSLNRLLAGIRIVNLALFANPVGLIVGAVALFATGLYLVIKNWDKIRERVKNVKDSTLGLYYILNPLVGLVLLLAKHWENFKRIFIAVAKIVKYEALLIFDSVKRAFQSISDFLMRAWEGFVNFLDGVKVAARKVIDFIFPDWLKNLGATMWNSIKAVGTQIKNFLSGLLPDWLKNFSLGNMLGKIADYTEGVAGRKEAEYNARTGNMPQPSSADSPAPTPATAGASIIPITGASTNISSTRSSTSNQATYSNPVVLESGAIQINVSGGEAQDAERIAELVMKKLRERERRMSGIAG